jgi:chaperone BCS1
LLNGKPGNGKSALVFEVARRTKMPIYVFDLSTMDNEEFARNMDLNLTSFPAIILFEDIDSVFEGRKNITATDNFGGLSFDCFINKLSGVKSVDNKFIFVTTNHLEKVDPAITRSGRIDEVIDLPKLTTDEKKNMAKVILSNLSEEQINSIVIEGEPDTTAEFENRCVRLALENYWKT